MNSFKITTVTRGNILGLIDHLTIDQLNKIPEGFSNNIIWNFGHLIATQQLLTYGLSGVEFLVSENIVSEFRKGSKPEKTYAVEDVVELKSLFLEVVNQTELDYKDDVFESFNSYETSFGITLKSIDDAIVFNNAHEALHMGLIMAMRKLV